jgi:predicted glycoside hydrolase/deacetylase ChbG (UPF0249 family)
MKIIINADDFGPIDFINEGVYYHTRQGNLDSVQALPNVDSAQLEKAFAKLHDAVPAGRKMEVGVHFTLTSGEPISGEDNAGRLQRWGSMVEKVKAKDKEKEKVQFKSYQHFDFTYTARLPLIHEEFLAQRKRIEDAVNKVNTAKGSTKLVVNSASSHHNLLTAADDLFEAYVDAASGLRVRSPKMKPVGTSKSYYGFVLPLLNASIQDDQRKRMKELNKAFAVNKYLGNKSIELLSPAYIDVEFYSSLGSMGIGNITDAKIRKRVKAFDNMIQTAIQYTPNTAVESHKKVIEFVFHLGRRDATMQNMDYEQMVSNYSGVTHKYFDNREVELRALEQLALTYGQYIKENVSWNECGTVKFLKQ